MSLWLIPMLMFASGAALAVVALGLSLSIAEGTWWARWISSGSGDDARNLISTLLTAVIAMASIAFSVTVVALSLAANTYGSRLIRIFRSDRRTQLVLGIFVLTIVYLLLVLRALRGAAPAAAVPEAAVALGSLLALLSVLALLAFIQGVASLITADEVVRRTRKEFDSAIAALPLLKEAEAWRGGVLEEAESNSAKIRLPKEGYVQSIEYSKIVRWAQENQAVVRLDFRPGDFVVDGDHKVTVRPSPRDAAAARKAIGLFIVCGQVRTPTQDLEFAIRNLVEVALRALSPGINDPFTAIAVLDRLRGGLAKLASRALPPPELTDDDGTIRVIRSVTSYAGAVDSAFNQIRQAGSSMPAILIHLLKAIEGIAEHTRTGEQREVLTRHAALALSAARRDVQEPLDLRDVEQAYRCAERALNK